MINETPGVCIWSSVWLVQENRLCEAVITDGIKATRQDVCELSINTLGSIFTMMLGLNSFLKALQQDGLQLSFLGSKFQSRGNEAVPHLHCFTLVAANRVNWHRFIGLKIISFSVENMNYVLGLIPQLEEA